MVVKQAAAGYDSDVEEAMGAGAATDAKAVPDAKSAKSKRQQQQQQPDLLNGDNSAAAAAFGAAKLSTAVHLLTTEQLNSSSAPKPKRQKTQTAAAAAQGTAVPTAPAAQKDPAVLLSELASTDTPLPPEAAAALGGFHPIIQRAMVGLGFSEPTPVQAQCWPMCSAERDVQAVAEPGSGKTLGYLLPALVRLHGALSGGQTAAAVGAAAGEKQRLAAAAAAGAATEAVVQPLVLVLAPSRELAQQVAVQCKGLWGITGVSCGCVYGGVDKGQQVAGLAARKPQLLVATPGRLLDLVDDGVVGLGGVQLLVLDEADKMLSVGFRPQLERLGGMMGLVGVRRKEEGEAGKKKEKKKRKEEEVEAGKRPQVRERRG